jgi:subtilase family serine protease
VKVRGYDAHGSAILTDEAPTGYDPATIHAYLGLTGTGKGQTVAVVDAPGDPAIAADLDHFDQQFGLPAAHLTIKTPQGAGDVDGGWGLETAMDVEWIHATAPDAAIVLVESRDGSFSSLFAAVDTAAALKPDAISLSWGIPEEFTDETYYDGHCGLTTTLCTVASGDRGWPGSYPAYNPHVLSVGGTTLDLGAGGAVTGETAWAGSGGGRSYVEKAPSFQKTGGRGTPDVSYVADPATGVAVYDTTPDLGQTGWFQVGGTSLGAPTWAALIAATDQLRAAAGRPRLSEAQIYAARTALGDITTGTNGTCPDVCTAGPGYDFVTGLGSPRAGLDKRLS